MKFNIPHLRLIEVCMVGNMPKEKLAQTMETYEAYLPEDKVLSKINLALINSYKNHHKVKKNDLLTFPPMLDIDPQWMENNKLAEGYAALFNPDYAPTEGFEEATKILQDPLLAQSLRTLAITGFSNEDIELHTNGKYDIAYDSAAYTMFFRYFFNINEWTLKDRRAYVTSQKWDTKTTQLYKEALKGDKPRMLWKLGFAPGLSIDNMLRDMLNSSYYHFKENEHREADVAQKWSHTFKNLAQQLDKIDTDSKGQETMYQEMIFKINGTDVDVDITSIDEVDASTPKKKSIDLKLDLGEEDDILDIEDMEDIEEIKPTKVKKRKGKRKK